MPYIVAGITFRTKKALTDHVRGIAARNTLNQSVAAVDFDFLIELFKRHPWARQKFGPGIDAVVLRQDEWANRTFEIIRVDGTRTDISWVQCITPPKPGSDAKAAFRVTITDQILAFKSAAFSRTDFLVCPITGVRIDWNSVHIDHAAPATFEALLAEFCVVEGLRLEDVETGGHGDGEQHRTLVDVEMAQRWWRFHKERAVLRVVSKRANLSDLRRGI